MPREKRALPWCDTRDNGVFYVFWYDAEARKTRRYSLGTRDGAEAQARFAAFLTEGKDLLAGAARGPRITVAQALDDYEREHVASEAVKDKTRQLIAVRHIRAFFGDYALADVDIPLSRQYAEARASGEIGGGARRKSVESRKGGPATIRRELVVFRAAVEHARRWKRIGLDVQPVVELPTAPPPSDTKWLSPAQFQILRMKASEHDDPAIAAFIDIAYYTAGRRASIETLEWSQVDLPAKRIRLQKPGEAVTKKRRPTVGIDDAILPMLKRMWLASDNGWVLGSPKDLYRPYMAVAAAAGLSGEQAQPHALRHTRASHLLDAGVPVYKVAKLLGDTVATVERVYAHACPNMVLEAEQ